MDGALAPAVLLAATMDGDEIVMIRGDFDLAARRELREIVRTLRARDGHRHVVVDLRYAGRVDTSGVAALLRADLLLRSSGRVLEIANPTANVLRLLRTTGLDRRLRVRTTA